MFLFFYFYDAIPLNCRHAAARDEWNKKWYFIIKPREK